MAAVLSPMWGLGFWNWWRYGEYGIGIILIGFAISLWLYGVGSLRVIATAHSVEMRRFIFREWKLDIDKTTISKGFSGPPLPLPAVILENKYSDTSGAIVRAPFSPKRLDEFLEYLEKNGAVRRG